MALLIYLAIFIPLRVTFDIIDYCPAPIWLIETAMDFFFVFDLALNFFTAVVPPENELLFSDSAS